tara:strand:+ start:292 stop:1215 length:924 start_codon:yes stop_codon:yes gene_type:complete
MTVFIANLTGRFGDRCSAHLNMRQLANILNTQWASSEWFGLDNVFHTKNRTNIIKRDFVSLSANEIREFKNPEKQLREIHSSYDIMLEPPYLGSLFYPLSFTDPIKFLNDTIKNVICDESKDSIKVGVHMRGEDFLQPDHNDHWAADGRWKLGLHSFEFYKKCTQEIIEDIGKNGKKLDKFIICTTTERSHPNLRKYLNFLEKSKIEYEFGMDIDCLIECHNDNYFKDWYHMATSEYIVTCPSVFSITAGYFSNAKILFNYEFVKKSSDVKDRFWADLFAGGNEFYKTWKYVDNEGAVSSCRNDLDE